jgi:hypothetical protein
MSSDERNQRLTDIQPDEVDERKERMRQLANVFIEMFVAQNRKNPETPLELAEAA